MVADCPKFIPNIFNQTKCSSCFKTREEHGDVALDAKGLRKVVKCGYLFIAPKDWDFCNPAVYRAKRWQRRWFVLWSDDQLSWSIDDQPDTIPQGTLDMREILEVKSAEEITEHPYSLSLTGKQTTFIKGMNNEDIKAWQSVLQRFGNRLITTGGGKRSLTLPGGFGGSSSSTTRFETGVVIGPSSRPRFHSVTSPSGPLLPSPPPTTAYGKSITTSTSTTTSILYATSSTCAADIDVDMPRRTSIPSSHSSSASSPSSSEERRGSGVFIASVTPKIGFGAVTPKSDATTPTGTTCATGRSSRSYYVSLSNVPKGRNFRTFPTATPVSNNRLLSSTILPPSSSSVDSPQSASPSEEQLTDPPSPPEEYGKRFPVSVPSHSHSHPEDRDESLSSTDVVDCPRIIPIPTPNSVRTLRGDPDGCGGLDNLDGGPLRKGWLLRQTNNDWTKHWFVLQNNSLIYYENSEEHHPPFGRIDITEDTIIRQFDSNRHYGFEVINNHQSIVHKLSAITNGMRGIWMKALEAAKSNYNKPPPEREREREPHPSSSSLANPPSPPLKSRKSRWRKKSDLKLSFESLKDEFAERERELENLRTELRGVDSPRMRELLKSQALQIDNFRTQISSGFMEIEKLELYCKQRESEYQTSLKYKDDVIEELKEELSREIALREKLMEQRATLEHQMNLMSQEMQELKLLLRQTEEEADTEALRCKELEHILEARNLQVLQELELLRTRCNDLTEKLYQSEKTSKSLKSKLGRVKSQSLKDKQVEVDVLNKISDLEEKLSKLDSSPASSGPGSVTSPTPMPQSPSSASASSGIINVIMKLNDLDQRVEKAMDSYWFRRGELEEIVGPGGSSTCQNCRLLEMELQEREERLEILEENLKHLESDFNNKVKELKEFVKEQGPSASSDSSPTTAQSVSKYQAEIEQLRSLCAKGLEAMENSHRRMVLELEEKHRREIHALKMEKDNELAEETKATLAALDAMRKNHQSELQKEISKFKEEFVQKFNSSQDLADLHREHEQELREVKEQILHLSEKYSWKCVEASKLEETIAYLKAQLNDAKRRILDMEGSDFQSIISCASSAAAASKKPDQVTALRSRLEQIILHRPIDETKTKTSHDNRDQRTGIKGGGGGGNFTEDGVDGSSSSNSTPRKPRHSIIRSPSCPKLTSGEARLSLVQ